MAFDLYEFLNKNKFDLGTVEKEVGDTVFKGGHNDLRKTNHEVNIKDGKLDLNTHRTALTEGRVDKNDINQELKNVKTPKELEKLFVKMYNEDADKLFFRLYNNAADPRVYKAFFDAIKKSLKQYPGGII